MQPANDNRGKPVWTQRQWRKLIYPGYFLIPSFCRLVVRSHNHSEHEGESWFLFLSHPENQGTSITNRSEVIAVMATDEIQRLGELKPMKRYFEFYPEYEQRFDEIAYEGYPARRYDAYNCVAFGSPMWRPTGPQEEKTLRDMASIFDDLEAFASSFAMAPISAPPDEPG